MVLSRNTTSICYISLLAMKIPSKDKKENQTNLQRNTSFFNLFSSIFLKCSDTISIFQIYGGLFCLVSRCFNMQPDNLPALTISLEILAHFAFCFIKSCTAAAAVAFAIWVRICAMRLAIPFLSVVSLFSEEIESESRPLSLDNLGRGSSTESLLLISVSRPSASLVGVCCCCCCCCWACC